MAKKSWVLRYVFNTRPNEELLKKYDTFIYDEAVKKAGVVFSHSTLIAVDDQDNTIASIVFFIKDVELEAAEFKYQGHDCEVELLDAKKLDVFVQECVNFPSEIHLNVYKNQKSQLVNAEIEEQRISGAIKEPSVRLWGTLANTVAKGLKWVLNNV